MDPSSAPLIISIVAVVLGGVGLIGGVIGYVQGTSAVARATHARQRAVVAEEEALQARAAAEAAARAAEELVQRTRPAGRAGSAPGRRDPRTDAMPEPTAGAALLPQPPAQTAQAPQAQPPEFRLSAPPPVGDRDPLDQVVLVNVVAPPQQDAPLPADPVGAGAPAERQPAETFTVPLTAEPPTPAVAEPQGGEDTGTGERAASPQPESAPEDLSTVEGAPPESIGPESGDRAEPGAPANESESVASVPSDAAPESVETRDERGRVAAGGQGAPTMDWAEVLRTGAIPLPSVSRGTYAPPRRRPKPTVEGPARFELRAIGRQRYEAVNVGGEAAADARVEGAGDDPHLVRPLLARPSTVEPSAALAFSLLRVEGRRAAIIVSWTRDGETVRQDLPVE